MAIKRYKATADNTITNAYKSDLRYRGTGSNMGAADSLEVFSIYGQQASGSVELSRILIKFPTADISTDRTNSVIPTSGNVDFILRMFNVEHASTVPKPHILTVAAVTQSWEEGIGLDMEEYKDLSYGGVGSNWEYATSGSAWSYQGGTYRTDRSSSFHVRFEDGVGDLEVNISSLVEQWLNSTGNTLGSKPNYGLMIKLTGSHEGFSGSAPVHNATGSKRSYYTKKFSSRSSEYFFKRPVIEARWDDSKNDNRGSFYYSSSLAPELDNLNTIYLYNYVRGRLTDIPGLSAAANRKIRVSIFSGSADNSTPSGSGKSALALAKDSQSPAGVVTALDKNVTGSRIATGIYSASFVVTAAGTPLTKLYDVWHRGDGAGAHGHGAGVTQYLTGTIVPQTFKNYGYNPSPDYVTSVTNLKDVYKHEEKARFKLFIREKDWSPNIYSRATTALQGVPISGAYYKAYRAVDSLAVIEYGTGSSEHTRLSYDNTGSYFDLSMDLLEPGYMYAFKLIYKTPDGNYREQPEIFKFRVE